MRGQNKAMQLLPTSLSTSGHFVATFISTFTMLQQWYSSNACHTYCNAVSLTKFCSTQQFGLSL